MKIVTASEMKRIDAKAIERGISGVTLMTRAGITVCDIIEHKLGTIQGKSFQVFCGSGKNGGDGFVIARELYRRCGAVSVYLVGEDAKMCDDTRYVRSLCERDGLSATDFNAECTIQNKVCDCIVDAIYGIGFHGTLRGNAKEACRYINNAAAFKVSVDLPSGVETDTANMSADAVSADVTVTFTLPKAGCSLVDGAVNCGELFVADIGIPKDIITSANSDMIAVDEVFLAEHISRRKRNSHKGDYGNLLIVGGSTMYQGAVFFTTSAAVNTGAGLVTSAVPEDIYPIIACKINEAMPYKLCANDGILTKSCLETLMSIASNKDACAIGMGIGRHEETAVMVREFIKNTDMPIVIDADGINALIGHIDIIKSRHAVITPHDGEMAALAGEKPPYGGTERVEWIKKYARQFDCTILLKGYRTIVASPDGRVYVNTNGNPGMAKGGSGDTLTGIITTLLGFKLEPANAAACGAYIHGAAGDLCAEKIGEYGMTPTDMLSEIKTVMKCY